MFPDIRSQNNAKAVFTQSFLINLVSHSQFWLTLFCLFLLFLCTFSILIYLYLLLLLNDWFLVWEFDL